MLVQNTSGIYVLNISGNLVSKYIIHNPAVHIPHHKLYNELGIVIISTVIICFNRLLNNFYLSHLLLEEV